MSEPENKIQNQNQNQKKPAAATAAPVTTSAITPTRSENYAEWYQQVVRAAELAETSPVRGCMVIKPWGYATWENIQRVLDRMFKDTGHRNAYFPLLIPLSFLEKEAEHVDGFAKECAVVTHHRLQPGIKADGKPGLVPAGELEEPLVVRPTSETIIGASFSKWVQSYRDLPLLINQWANVVRWEMRTRLFLRTTEFLWQEGHTAHATSEEAMVETMKMLEVYADFTENWMAMPVIKGEKTEGERFPGAVTTYCIEAMMQDRKALQAGTSHFLGQNFAKSSDIKFSDASGSISFAWTTSWGVSTRLIGGMIMTHADDDGMVLPPRLAPAHVVIIPVTHKPETAAAVLEYCTRLAAELRTITYAGRTVEVELDARDIRGGDKAWQWIKKGIPLRVEVGPRDMEQDSVFMARRDRAHKDKQSLKRDEFVATITTILEDMQSGLFARAKAHREQNSKRVDSRAEFEAFFGSKNDSEDGGGSVQGGFALAHYSPDPKVEDELKAKFAVTCRCIPIDGDEEPGVCIFTGRPSTRRAVFAKSY
ncbi:MAG: proline--tRNA ligase [Planctomycetota bacterium]|nr:MAG: proline--tRNA ligase [Planctomycetota bacterium]